MDFVKHVSKIGGALGDSGRVRIVLALKGKSLCICHIVDMLKLSFPTVSRHVAILEAAGLIRTEKRGKWTYCSLPGRSGDPAALGAIRWVQKAASGGGGIYELTDTEVQEACSGISSAADGKTRKKRR